MGCSHYLLYFLKQLMAVDLSNGSEDDMYNSSFDWFWRIISLKKYCRIVLNKKKIIKRSSFLGFHRFWVKKRKNKIMNSKVISLIRDIFWVVINKNSISGQRSLITWLLLLLIVVRILFVLGHWVSYIFDFRNIMLDL